MNYSQANSVFMPGLTTRGPVYNGMGALPSLSPAMKFALIAGLLGLGVTKKIPLGLAGIASALVWTLLPDAASAATTPITVTTNPVLTNPMADFSNMPLPTMPGIAGYDDEADGVGRE